MALIDTILSQIINAKYGRDVRQAIHDGIQQCYADAIVGVKGDQGISITSVQRTSGNGAEGTTDVYTVYFSDNTSSTFQVRHGSKGSTGNTGAKGDKGDPGLSIQSIVRTSGTGAEGTVDTYTITLTNGATQNFSIRNGSKGSTGLTGATGPKGDPGVSITNIVRTSGTGEEGTTDIYTIYLSSGASQTFTVKHGSRGQTGATGVSIRDVRKISGTGAEGTVDTYAVMLSDGENKNFDVRHGSKGSTGSKGDPGKGVVGINKVSGTGAPGTTDTYAISYTDGTVTNFNVYNGADGAGSTTAQKLANARALTIGAVSKLFDGSEDVTWSLAELDLAQRLHTHTTSQITDFPTEMPASDVYEWAKTQTKPTYTPTEVGAASEFHNHTTSDITNFPASMPASDVEAWAKALTKPSYTPAEVGAAPALHNHTTGSITDFPETMPPSPHEHSTNDITDFPTEMPPEAHNHPVSDLTDFPTEMPPEAHDHGNITSDGKIGTTADNFLVTGANGIVEVKDIPSVVGLIGVTNPNILHNWDFRNPVNQREVSGTISSGSYFYDRWIRNSGTVMVEDGYLTLTSGAEIEQRIEGLYLAGETVTVSVNVGSNIYSGTGVFPTETGTVGITLSGFGTATLGYNAGYMFVRFAASGSQDVVAVKCELGTASTLHLDPPMDRAVELPKCQRFFLDLGKLPYSFGNAEDATNAVLYFPLPVAMRIVPTLFGNTGNGYIFTTSGAKLIAGYGTSQLHGHMFVLPVTSSDLTTYHPITGYLKGISESHIYLSSDL